MWRCNRLLKLLSEIIISDNICGDLRVTANIVWDDDVDDWEWLAIMRRRIAGSNFDPAITSPKLLAPSRISPKHGRVQDFPAGRSFQGAIKPDLTRIKTNLTRRYRVGMFARRKPHEILSFWGILSFCDFEAFEGCSWGPKNIYISCEQGCGTPGHAPEKSCTPEFDIQGPCSYLPKMHISHKSHKTE